MTTKSRVNAGDYVGKQEDTEIGDIIITTAYETGAACNRLKKYKNSIELIVNSQIYGP